MGFFRRGWDLATGKVAKENKERFEEAQQIVESAKERYEHAVERFEAVKKNTEESLRVFGQYQLECLSSDIKSYVNSYSHFANLEYSSNLPIVADYNLPMSSPQFVRELSLSSENAFDIVKTNALSVGAGALTAVGVYGCGMLAGTTQAGVALSSLAGLTKGKAFLTWLGHGSMMGGALTIAGAVIIPFNIVSGLINEAKSKERLAEAMSIKAKVDQQIEELKTGISFCKKLIQLVTDYRDFLQEFAKLFRPMVKKLQEIEARELSGIDSLVVGMVDFQSLPDEEKKALHLSWLMVQIYNKILKTPLLNNQEDIAEEAQSTLASARATQKQLLPGLIELADNGTVDIAFAKETKLSRIIEKLFIITNWSMTAIAFLCVIYSFVVEDFDSLLPNRNRYFFAIGMVVAGIIGCPLLTRQKERDFVIGSMGQKKEHAIKLSIQCFFSVAVIIATFYLYGIER